jgi:SAM-dependent methyltransferase
MLSWLFTLVGVVLLLICFVVFFGPPYLPTMARNMETALDLLELKAGETMLDLGSGDGRVLLAAARRGVNVVGVELSPLLFAWSWLCTRRYRNQVRIIWGNYFAVTWPQADAIFTFMIPRQMSKLDSCIEQWRQDRSVRLASFAFAIPTKTPTKTRDGVFLYRYK